MATVIYLPHEYVNSCNVVYSNYIRSYTNSNFTQWVDIYINQDYQVKAGSSTYSQSVVCDNLNTYTDNIMYRTDIDKICLTTLIIAFVTTFPIYLLTKVFRKRMF